QDTMASRNGQFLLFDALPFLCPLPLDLLRRRRVGMVDTTSGIGANLDHLSALAAVHDDGLSHLVARLLIRGSLVLDPFAFGQLTHEPASGTSVSSCLSNGAEASCSKMFDSIHAANSRTGIRTWLFPSLVHKPRKEAENASCCCEAGSLAISRAWPIVIWSFR